ncbi:hypothetical protein HYPSUDRAFT_40134 [Hypholoma sublateritium FD-334 SS-4]|uniref:SUN domain-containing protein n=1 Tax=Hypholoma sublateritium (strain FD-334 SS-4) TaxID=945553 RepID=A0A0D2L7Z3_HYPSF|nr:hypothetical protein HYPSUDRAFT_40134 [Hypholoma sublateritium FD-334 SS-4]
MLSALPIALIWLLFASPVFSQSTSLNDPFRAITAQASKQKPPENPICCLKPLTPSEPVDDDVLLSFEEWKMKQLGMQKASSAKAEEEDASQRAGAAAGAEAGGDASHTSEGAVASSEESNRVSGSTEPGSPERPSFSPSKAPLTDRFNYASLDCSARIHTSHRSAKSPSSILSSKRDRYMLSPCDTPQESQHVVVELCDDIRIDTIQLANFEFFSGVFKDFTVSVAKTYTNDPDAWTTVQSYRAKNTRGVQTFRPPDDLLDFYRFIRIDFHSHYGNEYYCPVSLLRVYGLTHLEEWKWDIWESESRAKQAESQKKRQAPRMSTAASISVTSPTVDAISDSSNNLHATEKSANSPMPTSNHANSSEQPMSFSSPTIRPTYISPDNADQPRTQRATKTTQPASHTTHTPSTITTHHTDDPHLHDRPTDTYVTSPTSVPHIPAPSSQEENVPSIPISDYTTEISHPSFTLSSTPAVHSQPHPSHPSDSHSLSAETSTVVVSSNSPSVAVIPVPPAHHVAKGGESIYRTILNRLSEVEMNQTLYVRYIEQQNLAIRDVMKRLVEDVGRLEGITRAHTLNYQRNLDSWQRQRALLEMEYMDLVLRVEHLSEEVILEKRLGVAQLCLLLAVLVFMGLTRGSRAGDILDHSSSRLNRSVRQWGQRHFKLSNSWADRFKAKNLSIDLQRANDKSGSLASSSRSRSASPTTPQTLARPKPVSVKTYPTAQLSSRYNNQGDGIQFPSSSKTPFSEIDINTAPAHTELFPRVRALSGSNARSRAPSLRSTPVSRRIHHQRPTTPIGAAFRPQTLQRSNSHNASALQASASWGVPKSAKKWARTAHLHEVKTVGLARRARKKSVENVDLVVGTEGGKGKERREDSRTPREFEFGPFVREREEDARINALKFPFASPMRDASSAAYENSMLFKPSDFDSTPVEEGDAWVNTDSVDGSELGTEHDSLLDVGVASSAAHSSRSDFPS